MYKEKKIPYIIAMILFGGALPFTVWAMINGFEYGVTADSFSGVFAVAIHVAALCFFIYLYFHDRMAQVRKLQKTNPVLAQQMIDEVETAVEVCKNINKSASFYYFSGRHKILVVPIGQVKYIRVYTGYRRGVIGHYKAIEVRSDYGRINPVYVSVISPDDSAPDSALEQLATENNIQLKK